MPEARQSALHTTPPLSTFYTPGISPLARSVPANNGIRPRCCCAGEKKRENCQSSRIDAEALLNEHRRSSVGVHSPALCVSPFPSTRHSREARESRASEENHKRTVSSGNYPLPHCVTEPEATQDTSLFFPGASDYCGQKLQTLSQSRKLRTPAKAHFLPLASAIPVEARRSLHHKQPVADQCRPAAWGSLEGRGAFGRVQNRSSKSPSEDTHAT